MAKTISEAASAMAATAEFRKGGNAYRAGKTLTDNPHACPGTAWERWHYGWMAAEEDLLGDVFVPGWELNR